MISFSLTAPTQTLFGRDCRSKAPGAIASFGTRVLLVRGRSVAWVDDLSVDLRNRGCEVAVVWSEGEPDLDSVRTATVAARDHHAACVVAVGGGAAIDLGKAIAGLAPSAGDPAEYLEIGGHPAARLNNPLPFVAIPTTAGTGAEATRNAVIGLPEKRLKISLRDPRLVPDLAIVDPALTDGSPKGLTLASGLDAVTQLIESYLCTRATPVTDAICSATICDAIGALKTLMQREDAAARDILCRASYLSGLALANSGLGIVHGLASVIGGRGGAHGAICGRLLADALDINAQALARQNADGARIAQVDHWLARGLGVTSDKGVAALRAFIDAHGLPSLRELGVSAADIPEIAQQALHASSTKANPVDLGSGDIAALLERAQ